MTTEPQPTPTSASAPLPQPRIGAEVPPPGPGVQSPAPGLAQPELASGEQPPAAPQPAAPQHAAPLPQHHRIKRTRISGLWVALGFFAVVLLLLLIFILQNGTKVDISYMGAHGHLPLGVALLLSAVCGVLLVVLAGAARISQLRTVARRHRRADTQRGKAAQAQAQAQAQDSAASR
jgi:lipopolysaccharide assembly protein A